MELFVKIVHGFQLPRLLNVWQGSEHAPECTKKNFLEQNFFTHIEA